MITRSEYAALSMDTYHDENYKDPSELGFTQIYPILNWC